ncbi:MAG TPA: glycosyltransferase, partial [Lachnospiraceae bacterium]|nr:glycosyltransferase [Lachnospiraceae bacterium]
MKTTKITFVSNYINHHQIPFSNAMYERLGPNYSFIQTEPMEEERVRMGWGLDLESIPYLLCLDREETKCKELLLNSDVVIFGGTEQEELIKPRLVAKKITIRNSERLYREGQWKAISPRGLIKKYKDHTKYRKSNVFLLSIGGYTASDYSLVRAYPHKKFKWGYFPETKIYNVEELMNGKNHINNKGEKELHILWAGRFMPLKHPGYAIQLAKQLKEDGFTFHLDMVGGGELDDHLRKQVLDDQLQDVVTFHGFMKPHQVRNFMEKANIFLFTSNYLEGWGAVVNEAMNSGCAVVASHAVGSTCYLIQDEYNGLIYKNNCYSMFYKEVKSLFNKREYTKELGNHAYQTITQQWNAENASDLLIRKCEQLSKGTVLFEEDGP